MKITRITSFNEIRDAFYKLKDNFYCFDGDIDKFIDKIYENGICFVCSDDTICGLMAFYANNHDTKTAFVSSVLVDANYRKRGIATKLINAAEEYSRENHMTHIALQVNKNNKAAIDLYHKLNYIISFENDNTYNMIKVIK